MITKQWMKKLFGTKACAEIVLTGVRRENVYYLVSVTQSWNLPGRITALHRNIVRVELEGRESALRAYIDKLPSQPMIRPHNVEVKWTPFTGRYTKLTTLLS